VKEQALKTLYPHIASYRGLHPPIFPTISRQNLSNHYIHQQNNKRVGWAKAKNERFMIE